MSDILGFFNSPEYRAQSRRVQDSVMPSDYLPKKGEFFRMRHATISCRSYIDCIFKCLSFEEGAVLGEKVFGSSYGDEKRFVFVVGDCIFYRANEIGALLAEPATDALSDSQESKPREI